MIVTLEITEMEAISRQKWASTYIFIKYHHFDSL